MITVEKILRDIEKIIVKELGIQFQENITLETNFFKDELSMDSLTIFELIIKLGLMYEIELDKNELTVKNFERASSIVKFIIDKIEIK